MNTFALALALVLQLTGTWAHLTPTAHQDLAAAARPHATTPQAVKPFVLPIRTGNGTLALPNDASILGIDRATSLPLYSQNADKQRPIASITKLITALVILSDHNPEEAVTIGTLPDYPLDAETIGLRQGETYRLGDLVSAALVPSANDAADALAIYDSGSVMKFAGKMDAKMAKWDIKGTHFASASGLTDDGNYATARALAQIGLLAMDNPTIKATVIKPTLTFNSKQGRAFSLESTNKLLAEGGFYGIKTGYTGAAGQCFVGITPVSGHDVVTVVLGTNDRFGDTQSLVNWIGSNWQWF